MSRPMRLGAHTAVITGTASGIGRALLPALKQSDDARIINMSSVFGLIAPPGQTAYCASKFAVRGFPESLRRELRQTTVGVTMVHPGGATGISEGAACDRRRVGGTDRGPQGEVQALSADAAGDRTGEGDPRR